MYFMYVRGHIYTSMSLLYLVKTPSKPKSRNLYVRSFSKTEKKITIRVLFLYILCHGFLNCSVRCFSAT